MHFEVYADSYLLLQFVMNIYLLALVNKMLHQTVSKSRIIRGAACGALLSLLSFLVPMKLLWCMGLSVCLSVVCMTIITFRTHRLESFWCVLEKMAVGTIFLGGGIVVLLRILPKGDNSFLKITAILATGGILYIFFAEFVKKNKKNKDVCRVTLFGKEKKSVEALLDTGNGLREPISGKPVAILDREIFEQIFGEEKPIGFRMIPYHSIGKRHGVLPGYLLEKIVVETKDGAKEYQEIYVGISDNIISGTDTYKMIMHPEILK